MYESYDIVYNGGCETNHNSAAVQMQCTENLTIFLIWLTLSVTLSMPEKFSKLLKMCQLWFLLDLVPLWQYGLGYSQLIISAVALAHIVVSALNRVASARFNYNIKHALHNVCFFEQLKHSLWSLKHCWSKKCAYDI